MARNFVAASSQFLSNTSLVVSATPMTFACWFKPVANNVIYGLMFGTASGSSVNYWGLDTDASGHVLADTNGVSAVTSTTFSAGAWAHACAVFASATDRRVYLNGGGKGTNATSRTPTSPVRTSIGALNGSAVTKKMDGDIAEAAMWNIALSDAEVLMLSTGVSPLMVRPDALVFYAPLIGKASPEPDYRGAFNLTLNAAPIESAHPRIYYPSSGKIRRFKPAATGSAVGSAAGVGAAAGTGASVAVSPGSSAGVGTAAGIGASIAQSSAAAAGLSTVAGIGASIAASIGASAGIGSANGIGAFTGITAIAEWIIHARRRMRR